MSTVFFLVVVIALGVGGFLVWQSKRAGADDGVVDATVKFKSKTLMTANELEFLTRLEEAVPEWRFHAQVAMGAILDPVVARQDGKAYFRARGMFSQKIVDFVAQSRSDGLIMAIIELDDKTHNADKDLKRDGMLTGAGYRVVRYPSKAKPNSQRIRADLFEGGPQSDGKGMQELS